jgi:hypothetical protein
MRIKGTLSRDESFDRSGNTVYKIGRTTDITSGILDIVGLQRQTIKLPDGHLYVYTDVLTVKGDGQRPFSEPEGCVSCFV